MASKQKTEKFFQTGRPIEIFLTSQSVWIKNYQAIILIVTLATTFNLVYCVNLGVLKEGFTTIGLYSLAVSASGMFCMKMSQNMTILTSKINTYWIWIGVYSLILLGYGGFIQYVIGTHIEYSAAQVAEFGIFHFLILHTVTTIFWIWIYYNEGSARPIFKKSLIFKFASLFISWIVVLAACFIYFYIGYEVAWEWFKNLKIVSYIFIGFFGFIIGLIYITCGLKYYSIKRRLKSLKLSNGGSTMTLSLAGLISISLWYLLFNPASKIILDTNAIIFLVCCLVITLIYLILSFKLKNELKSSISKSSLLTISLAIIWTITLFFIIAFDAAASSRFIMMGTAGMCTGIILLFWTMQNVRTTPIFQFLLTSSISVMFGLLLAYSFFDYYNLGFIAKFIYLDELFILLIVILLLLIIFYLSLQWYVIIRQINRFRKKTKWFEKYAKKIMRKESEKKNKKQEKVKA